MLSQIQRRMKKTFSRKTIATLCAITCCSYIYIDLNLRVVGTYLWRNINRCKMDEKEMKELTGLVKETHNILQQLDIPHFLAYGRYEAAFLL